MPAYSVYPRGIQRRRCNLNDITGGKVENGESFLDNQLMLEKDDGPGYPRNAEVEYVLSYNEEGSFSEDMFLVTNEE